MSLKSEKLYPKALVIGVSSSVTRKSKEGKGYAMSYCEAEYDVDGWADPNKFLPEPFDLVSLMTDQGKRKTGWWTGYKWECRTLTENEKVCFWSRIKEEVENGKKMDSKSNKKPWGFKSIFEDPEGEGHFTF